MKTLFSRILLIAIFLVGVKSNAQNNPNPGYWQQHVDYTMEIDMDVETFQYQGKQKLVYTNNSPDVLDRVFYHLYLNAFQPGSNMDMRLQNIADPDGRMTNNIGTKEKPVYESRISKLKQNEIGYIKVASLTQNGKPLKYDVVDTVLEVELASPIKPGEKVVWVYADGAQEPHSVTSGGCRVNDCSGGGKQFNSGLKLNKPGQRFEHVFTNSGIFPYHCDLHLGSMQGSVTVQDSH